jgi:hypothetical protein
MVQCSNPGGAGRVSGGCPEGYTCYSSPLLDQNVCCGASTELQALCPASSTPFISALSLQPMQCTPNVDGACPGNFFCWFSTTTTAVNAFYCCRSPDSVDTGCRSLSSLICITLFSLSTSISPVSSRFDYSNKRGLESLGMEALNTDTAVQVRRLMTRFRAVELIGIASTQRILNATFVVDWRAM